MDFKRLHLFTNNCKGNNFNEDFQNSNDNTRMTHVMVANVTVGHLKSLKRLENVS
jgi:hypothetical protein